MKKNIKDIFDSYADDAVDIKPDSSVSAKKIVELTMNKVKEESMNSVQKGFTIRTAVICAASILICTSVAAAYKYLCPKEIAERVEDYKLVESFSKEDTIFNFEPQTSGEFTINVLGVISGKNLSDFSDADIDKSYIVGAISRADGKPLTDYTNDIMVTPLISDFKPWQVNAFTLNGSRQSFLCDGVEYFIFESDNIEIFADHTIYIAAYEGNAPGSEIFNMNSDGSISFNADYNGVKAIFVLPIDKSKADPEAVNVLMEKMFSEEENTEGESDQMPTGEKSEEIVLTFDGDK